MLEMDVKIDGFPISSDINNKDDIQNNIIRVDPQKQRTTKVYISEQQTLQIFGMISIFIYLHYLSAEYFFIAFKLIYVKSYAIQSAISRFNII